MITNKEKSYKFPCIFVLRSFVRFVLSLLKIHINRIIPTGSQRSTRCDLHQCLLVSFVMRKYTYVREREKWRDGDNDSAAVLRYTEENIYKSARDFCQWENLPANGAKIVRNNETLRTHKICGRSVKKASASFLEIGGISPSFGWQRLALFCFIVRLRRHSTKKPSSNHIRRNVRAKAVKINITFAHKCLSRTFVCIL